MSATTTVVYTCDTCGKLADKLSHMASLPDGWYRLSRDGIDWPSDYSQNGYTHQLDRVGDFCSVTCLFLMPYIAPSFSHTEEDVDRTIEAAS